MSKPLDGSRAKGGGAMTLTTHARLRHARAALRQAATLLRDAANLGTMSNETRSDFLAVAHFIDSDTSLTERLAVLANRDLEAVRANKRKRAAA